MRAASSPLDIEVLEAGPDGFVLRWTPGKPTFSGTKEEQQAMLKRLAELASGVSLELELDPTGSPTGLRNADAVRETMDRVFAGLRTELSGQGMPDAMLEGLFAQLRATYKDESAILSNVAKDVPLYFFPLGWEFEPGKPRDYEDEIPSPIGGVVFPSRGRLVLESVDASRARILWTQSLDRERAADSIKTVLRSLAGPAAPGEDELADIKAVDISDETRFTLDVRTGWILEMDYTRTARQPGIEQIERRTIRVRE